MNAERLASADGLIGYFGYGSLVNLKTLTTPYIAAFPCTLSGWRRRWQGRPEVDGTVSVASRALLSAYRDRSSAIGGMLIFDRVESLAELDLREHHYRRVMIAPHDLTFNGQQPTLTNSIKPENLFVYEGAHAVPGEPPLLQSYLHTVMDGFENAHGAGGLEAFLATTDGFARPIIADWREPIYPRMTPLSVELRARYDAMLQTAGVIFP